MSVDSVAVRLGASFHDGQLESIAIDWVDLSAIIEIDLFVGDLSSSEPDRRDRWRRARLVMTGLRYLIIDPPDPGYPHADGGGVDIDSCGPDPAIVERFPPATDDIVGRFFVSDWNAFIHFSCARADLNWVGGSRPGSE